MKNRKKWIIWGAVVTVFILTPVAVVLLIELAYKNALDDLRNQGYPTNLEELDAYYAEVPDKENAALVYETAFDLLRKPDDVGLKGDDVLLFELDLEALLKPGVRLPKRVMEATATFLGGHKQVLQILREASARPTCRFSLEIRKGYDTPMPHLRKMNLCLLLSLQKAVLSANKGDAAACVDWLRVASSISQSSEQEPFLSSQFANRMFLMRTVDTVAYCLGTIAFNAEDLHALDDALGAAYSQDGIMKGIVGERVVALSDWKKAARIGENAERAGIWGILMDDGRKDQGWSIHDLPPIETLNKLQFLYILDRYYEDEERSYAERLAMEEAVKSDMDDWSSTYLPCRSVLFSQLLPPRKQAHYQARYGLIKLILAAETMRTRTGSLPTSLEGLVPDVLDRLPSDPFTDKPFRVGIKTVQTELTKEYVEANPQCEKYPDSSEAKPKPSVAEEDDPFAALGNYVVEKEKVFFGVLRQTFWIVYSVGPNLVDDGGDGDDVVMMVPVERPKAK